MRLFITILLAAALAAPAVPASASDWADATPTAWHQLARAESLLSAPEPPNPVAVCIVDSGVNITPDLEGVVIERLAYDGGDPGDTYPQEGIDDGHGTYVATFLAGQVNGWGGAGLWPRAKIVSVRVFPPGAKRAKAADYLRGIRLCRQRNDVVVINLSLGDIDGSHAEFEELENRLTDLRKSDDINVVAAAGNRGGAVEVPARYAAAFAVGATRGTGSLCSSSARGEGMDIVAPGCDLDAAGQGGEPAIFSGTSFAAPIVSAALAALRGYASTTATEAEAILLGTARRTSAGPLVDVSGALASQNIHWATLSKPPPSASSGDAEVSIKSGFTDYPRPRARITPLQRGRYSLRVNNRPRTTSIELRLGGRIKEYRRSWALLAPPRVLRSLSVRFIGDDGVSPWIRLPLRRR